MSYSIMSSSSSVDLLIPPPTKKEKLKKWFPFISKSLVGAILCAVLFIVIYDIRRRHIMDSVTAGLKCYECTSSVGMNLSQPGLPFENTCRTKPKNVRRCASGELCSYGTTERRGMRRFIRRCTTKADPKPACVEENKPFKFHFCFCNTDLCNDKL